MFIECKPIGKQRPKFTRIGGYPRAYTPKPTKDLENKIKTQYFLEGGKKHNGFVELTITAYFNPIASATKKQKEKWLEEKWYDKKPDLDNIVKLVMDGLNGEAYEDDKQVVDIKAKKIYSEIEGIQIDIKEV